MTGGPGPVLVTGPGVYAEKETPELGLSFALTCAGHAAKSRLDETFYVHLGDEVVGRCDGFADGTVNVYDRTLLKALAARHA